MQRTDLQQSILLQAKSDPRIVAILDYGSTCQGLGDPWSDLDLVVFIRDEAFPAFEQAWKTWAGQCGKLMLAYTGGVGHPWAVFEGEPIPIRVDFAFYRASQTAEILKWPVAPLNVESMVLYDVSAGEISANVAKLPGRSLAPDSLEQAFEQVAGDFWYYLLRLYGKIQRGQWWAARFEFNFIVTGNLHALLRLEAGAVEKWKASTAATGIESAISAERLMQLNACIPEQTREGLLPAIRNSIQLGQEVCVSLQTRLRWQWPAALAEEIALAYGKVSPGEPGR